jgi:hypothetical protein
MNRLALAALSIAIGSIAITIASASLAGAPDADHDGIPDSLDKCMNDPRNAKITCDTDCDGYGNVCDGDFDQSGTTTQSDFDTYFTPSLRTGTASPRGTDMNCNGTTNSTDFSMFFVPQLNKAAPGPSGLACAGQPGCGC